MNMTVCEELFEETREYTACSCVLMTIIVTEKDGVFFTCCFSVRNETVVGFGEDVLETFVCDCVVYGGVGGLFREDFVEVVIDGDFFFGGFFYGSVSDGGCGRGDSEVRVGYRR